MKYDPQKHHRRSIRLKDYDYTQPGAYFVTFCTYQSESLLGDVIDGEMVINPYGQIVQNIWDGLPKHYPHVRLDEFCIMPNHIHAIILLTDLITDSDGPRTGGTLGTGGDRTGGFETRPYTTTETRPYTTTESRPHIPKRHALPEIVRALKTFSARRINEHRDSPGVPVWHRNYYEHIIRNDGELHTIRQYILSNPQNWQLDRDNPHNRA